MSDVDVELLAGGIAASAGAETVRHERIDEVIESTTVRAMFELRSEHDLTLDPRRSAIGSPESLLAALVTG